MPGNTLSWNDDDNNKEVISFTQAFSEERLMKKNLLYFVYFFFFVLLCAGNGRITISERSDYTTYINGVYTGLTYREAYIYLDEKATVQNNLPAYEYEGEAFVLEETRKNMIGTVKKLDEIRPVFFTQKIQPDAANIRRAVIQFKKDEGYPLLRNFPITPDKNLEKHDTGKKWTAESVIVVCPQRDKNPTRIPVVAEYQYLGEKIYNGRIAHYVRTQFGVRYQGGDALGDADMLRSEGNRIADIYLDEHNRPLFIREKIDETFFYKNTATIKRRGFLLHFYDYAYEAVYTGGSVPASSLYKSGEKKPAPTVSNKERIKDKKRSEYFDVRETARVMLLNLKNLNFVADKAQLLDNEEEKLDETAAVLKTLTFKTLFVEGHTADVGEKASQQDLSLRRAKVVVDELVKRGIPAGKFMYSGAGGAKPIASNATETERAKNRRVEITVME